MNLFVLFDHSYRLGIDIDYHPVRIVGASREPEASILDGMPVEVPSLPLFGGLTLVLELRSPFNLVVFPLFRAGESKK